MKLTGSEYQQLQRALLSACPNRNDIKQMLMFELGEALDAIVGSGNLSETIFELIQWAVARGQLGELIAGAQHFNPNNSELRAFVEQVWQAKAPEPPLPAARSEPTENQPSTDPTEREHLNELLAIQQRNLHKLERQEALHGGIDVPLHILNQLDEVRSKIAQLEAQLNNLRPQAQIAEPRQNANLSATPPSRTQPTARRHDTYTPYETALEELLRRLGPQHARYAEALTYQQRLAENIDTSRRYGDTETTRAGRAQIVGQLNGLALDALGVSFNQLM